MKTDQLFYAKAYEWILTNGPKVLLALALFIIGQWVIKLCRRWLSGSLSKRRIDPSLRSFFHGLLITAMQVILVLTVMQILGIQMTIFAAAIASLGVAAGLALSGTLQNFTSGILILILKPYKVGDNVIAQGQDGIVTSIQLFHTLVLTADNKTVIIPNSKLSNEVIINISREGDRRRVDIEMKFGYGSDLGRIREVIQSSLGKITGVQEPPPTVGVSAVEADGYRLIVHAWVDPETFGEMKLKLNEALLDGLKTAGIKS